MAGGEKTKKIPKKITESVCKTKKRGYSMGVNRKEDTKKDLKDPTPTRRKRQGEKTMKNFTADELYEIALDEYQKAGRHIGQDKKMGLTQWAYWSAEREDFHSEDEARAELRAFSEEEMGDMQD